MSLDEKIFTISDFGAVPSDQELQTEAIQRCIDACKENGGGKIVIPTGTYLIGSLRLYSNMTFYLEAGAVLLGSKAKEDYQCFNVPTTIGYLNNPHYKSIWHLPDYYFYAIITAFNEENITIAGEPGSLIDGVDVYDPDGEEQFRGPMGILMSRVNNLKLSGYTVQNSANWSHTLDGCETIAIEDVTIKAGHDGFNLHHSKHISVKDCYLETGDDCFAGYDIEELVVTNCQLNTACNGLRIGGRKLSFSNCTFLGPGRYPHLSEETYYTHAVFKFYSMGADTISSDAAEISLSQCIISDADKLLFYDHGRKEIMQDHVPLRSFSIENSVISGIRHSSLFKGNGEQGKLLLKNVCISHESPEPFLIIDDSIELSLENVIFEQPTTIITQDSQLQVKQLTNLCIKSGLA